MLIIITSLRIGNDINRRLYNSFGLTTLQKQYISVARIAYLWILLAKKALKIRQLLKINLYLNFYAIG